MNEPKKIQEAPDHQKTLEKIIAKGVPVTRAEFQSNVNNANGVPESFFSKDSSHKTRHVEMWYIPGEGVLFCRQDDKYFFTPLANVIKGTFDL